MKLIKKILPFVLILAAIFSLPSLLRIYGKHNTREITLRLLERENVRTIEDIKNDIRVLNGSFYMIDYYENFSLFLKIIKSDRSINSIRLCLDWLYYNSNISESEETHSAEEIYNMLIDKNKENYNLFSQIVNERKQYGLEHIHLLLKQ